MAGVDLQTPILGPHQVSGPVPWVGVVTQLPLQSAQQSVGGQRGWQVLVGLRRGLVKPQRQFPGVPAERAQQGVRHLRRGGIVAALLI